MISNFKHPAAQKVCANSPEINFADIHSNLAAICQQRFHAYTIACSYTTGNKHKFDEYFRIIELIRVELKIAVEEMNQREAIKRCLKLENHFRFIANRKNPKVHKAYIDKLEVYMQACRTYLGWKSQNAA